MSTSILDTTSGDTLQQPSMQPLSLGGSAYSYHFERQVERHSQAASIGWHLETVDGI